MDLSILITYIVIPAIAGLILFIARSTLIDQIESLKMRLADLEIRMRNAVSEQQVRQVIEDKLEPVCEDIKEIKEKINKQFDLYVESLNKNKQGD